MKLFQLRLNTSGGKGSWRRLLWLGSALGLAMAFLPQAKADFTGDYALSNFTLTNINSDGSVTTPDNGMSIVLTGPNTGAGDTAGTTDLTIAAVGSGLVSFDYLYNSLDQPQNDYAGYLLGGTFVKLADTNGQSGSAHFQVSAGEIFGFEVDSIDNQGEPGILTVSAFSAPSSTSTAPEPGSILLVASGAFLAIGMRRMHRKGGPKE